MRIGLCGAGGTGKGTIAKAFCAKHPEVKLIPSTVQHIGQMLDPDSDNYRTISAVFKPDFQRIILAVQAETERTMDTNHLSYISERSLIDFIPYMDRVLKDLYGYIPHGEHGSYMYTVKHYLRETPYTHIFFLPADDFDPGDGEDAAAWKERDPAERARTNEELKKHLHELAPGFGIPVTILSGSVEERLEQMEKALA